MKSLLIFIAALAAHGASFTHFPGTSLPANWTAVTSSQGSLCMNGTQISGGSSTCTSAVTGETFMSSNTAANADAAFGYFTIDPTKSQTIRVMASRLTGVTSGSVWLVNAATPAAAANATFDATAIVRMGFGNTATTANASYWDNAGTRQDWDDTTHAFVTAGATFSPSSTDAYEMFIIHFDAANSCLQLSLVGATGSGLATTNQGQTMQMVTPCIAFASVRAFTNLTLVLGDPYTDAVATANKYEWVDVADGLTPSGTAYYGGINARNDGGTWCIRIVRGYGSVNGYPEFMMPITANTCQLAVTGAAWDATTVKDAQIILDPSTATYWMFYSGSSGGNFQVGCASASIITGTWTKCTNSPIIVRSAGTNRDQLITTISVMLDLNEPLAARRWKATLHGVNTSIIGFPFESHASTPDIAWSTPAAITGIGGTHASISLASGNCVRTSNVITCTLSNTYVQGTPAYISGSLSCPTSDPLGWYTVTSASGSAFSFAHTGSDGSCSGTGDAYYYDADGITSLHPTRLGGIDYAFYATRTASVTGSMQDNWNSYGRYSEAAATITPSNAIVLGVDYAAGNTTLTANVSATRTLSVTSTTGFVADQCVIVDSNTNTSQGIRGRVLRVTNSTSMDLYEKIDGPASGGVVRACQRWDMDARFGYPLMSGGWWTAATCYRPYGDVVASVDMYNEAACLFTGTSPFGPWTPVYLASPLIYPGASWMNMLASYENLALVQGPQPAQPRPRIGRF